MKTGFGRYSPSSRIPGYSHNAVLQLIVASGAAFILYHIVWVFIKLANAQSVFFDTYIKVNAGLPPVAQFSSKFWTVFTYGWIHSGFWELFSNMLWMYCFGSVVQMLIGYRQVIPMFIYSIIVGALFYEGAQLIPGDAFAGRPILFGAQAAVVGFAVAALTISPNYRYYFTPTFSVPLVVIACIFFALMVMNSNLEPASLFLIAGGALTGFGYVKILQAGNKPGAWMYGIFESMDRMVTPSENVHWDKNRKRNQVLNSMRPPKQTLSQNRIDEILDKINQHGYNSLSKEEKEILMKAGKENH